jgi:hypothetical protein
MWEDWKLEANLGHILRPYLKKTKKSMYICFIHFSFIATGSCYVAQDDLELEIHLPQPPGCWDYRHVLPHGALFCSLLHLLSRTVLDSYSNEYISGSNLGKFMCINLPNSYILLIFHIRKTKIREISNLLKTKTQDKKIPVCLSKVLKK